MHELAIAENLLAMAGQEMQKRGLSRLLSLRVRCGALAGVMPEALEFAVTALARTQGLEIRLEIVREPLWLRCVGCGQDFEPAHSSPFTACPFCGYEFFHQVFGGVAGISGTEIFFDCMEVE